MAEPYLVFEAAAYRLVAPAALIGQIGGQAPAQVHDLSARFGGPAAAAWVSVAGRDLGLGVCRVLTMLPLEPDDFAPLPDHLRHSGPIDAVTRQPVLGAHALRLDLTKLG